MELNRQFGSVCRNRHLTIQLPLFFTNLVSHNILSVTNIQSHVLSMKELYREIKINKHGLRFLPKLSLSGLAEVVYFYLII